VVRNKTSEKFKTLSAFPEPIPRQTAKGFTPINQNSKFATITKKKKLSNKIKLTIKIRTFFPLASGYTGLQPLLTEVIPESVIVCWGNFKRVSVITIPFSSNMISGFLFQHAPYFSKHKINPYFCEYRIPIEFDSNKYHRQQMRKPRIVYSTLNIAATTTLSPEPIFPIATLTLN
jgi:hypothetical protein